MRVSITKHSFLRQLPDREDLPDILYFEAIPCEEIVDPLDKEYPDLQALFTKIEWNIFKEFLKTTKVSLNMILGFCKGKRTLVQNNAAVHIKNIRQKLKSINSNFEIKTGREGFNYYYLIKKP